MKKLLTFAGVSALALITAAPDAFAAAGRFDPECQTGTLIPVTIKSLTVSSGSTTPTLGTLLTLYFNPLSAKWYQDEDGETEITKLSDVIPAVPELGPVQIGDVNATNGAVPYVITLSGQAVTEVSSDMLTGTSQCNGSNNDGNNNMFGKNDIGISKDNDTLPNLQSLAYANDNELVSGFSFFVRYAANCVTTPEDHARCELKIVGKQAIYTNSCMAGYGNGNWGKAYMYCQVYQYLNPPAQANDSVSM